MGLSGIQYLLNQQHFRNIMEPAECPLQPQIYANQFEKEAVMI